MIKRFTIIVFLSLAAAGFINAQSVNRSAYEKTTLGDYELWLNQAKRNDAKKFQAPVLFSMRSESTLYFTDLDKGSFTGFEAEPGWSALKENQPVVVYFTATGAMGRVIDDIDDRAASAASTASLGPGASASPAVSLTKIKISGIIPNRGTNGVYRLQVGSYTISANAVRAFNKLKEAGLNPAYELYGNFTRVVLSGIRADEVYTLAEKISAAGFVEIWCRKER